MYLWIVISERLNHGMEQHGFQNQVQQLLHQWINTTDIIISGEIIIDSQQIQLHPELHQK